MESKNTIILNPDELIKEVSEQGKAMTSLLSSQYTTLQMLDGTLLMSFGMHSQLFAAMLGELALQSSIASAQLDEQQLYDAAALEGASAMYLLVSTLSGDVDRMTGYLSRIMNFSETINGSVGQVLPLLKEMGTSGGGINDAANTTFGAIGALSDLTNMTGNPFAAAKGLGKAITGVGKVAGIVGKLGALGPVIGAAAPLVVGGLAVAGLGTMAYKAYKKSKAKKAEENNEKNAQENPPNPLTGAEDEVDTPRVDASVQVDTAQALIDPFNTGAGDKSRYNQYQSQIESSQLTADTLRNAVMGGNTEVAAQLSAVADGLKQLSNKPADRHVKSEIVINTLRTNQTLSEFRDMLNEVLKMEEQVSV